MTIKQKLMEAAKNINTAVELDSIFESVELSDDVKAKFQTVFETAVKAQAVRLAESHIADIATQSEELVEAKVQEELGELTETLNEYLDHVAGRWLEENALAVDNSIKVDMFESMIGGLQAMFVAHNINVPAESVDVVAELEQDIAEAREELRAAIAETAEVKGEMNVLKRDAVVESAISNLALSQKEKVKELVEGLEFNELFEGKLSAIVEMTAGTPVVEAKEEVEEAAAEVIAESQEEALNFQSEEALEESAPVDPMAQYLNVL